MANTKTRRILLATNWTTLVISIVAAGRMVWEMYSNGADSGNILLLSTFLITGISSVLQLINLRRQAHRKTENETTKR